MYYYCVMKQSFELNDTIKQLTTIKINNKVDEFLSAINLTRDDVTLEIVKSNWGDPSHEKLISIDELFDSINYWLKVDADYTPTYKIIVTNDIFKTSLISISFSRKNFNFHIMYDGIRGYKLNYGGDAFWKRYDDRQSLIDAINKRLNITRLIKKI